MSQIRRFGRFGVGNEEQSSRHRDKQYDRCESWTDRYHHSQSVTHYLSQEYHSHSRPSYHSANYQHDYQRPFSHQHELVNHQVPHKHGYYEESGNSKVVHSGRWTGNEEWSGVQTVNCTQSWAEHHYPAQTSQGHSGTQNRKRKRDATTTEREHTASSSKKLKGPLKQGSGSCQPEFQRKRTSAHSTHVKQLTFVETLPYPAEGVEVLYTNDPDRAESWLQSTVINNSVEAIGLDIEWKPQFVAKKLGGKENKSAVIQLSVQESCLVLHIFHMKSYPPSLSQVLSDTNIFKVGSGINGDVTRLQRDTGLLCDGRIDTQEYAKALGIGSLGLKNLSREVLDIEMDKPKRISLSNWEYFPLNKRQIHYAALDAWISLKLYLKLKEKLDEENKGKDQPKTIQVHCGAPALGKKARKEKKKEWIQHLLSKKKTNNAEFSTVTREGSLSEKHETVGAGNKPKPSGDCSSTTEYQDVPLTGKHVQDKSESSNNMDVSISGVSFEPSSSTTDAKIQKKSAAQNDNNILHCPIIQCRNMKFTVEEDLQEHIKTTHVTCKTCGKLYRSKVSAKHKKQHRVQLSLNEQK